MTLASVAALQGTGSRLVGSFDEGAGARGTIRDQVIATSERSSAEVQQRAAAAGATAQGAFNTAEGVLERGERAITGGAGRDARAQRSSKRKLGLARALADVNARNLNVRGQRGEIRAAQQAAGGLRAAADTNILSGQSSLAQDETQRNLDFQADKAAFESKKAGGIGAIAGFAANFIPVVGPLVAPAIKSIVTGAVA